MNVIAQSASSKVRRLVECVPNFSEGRDAAVVDRIAQAMRGAPGVAILGQTMDPDHNRSVITVAGTPEGVLDSVLRGVSKAVELIDLTRHEGVHPRLGAADVIPFVPVSGVTLEECAALAEEAAGRIWRELGVPVYLYEAAARWPERKKLEDVRRGGFELLRDQVRNDPAKLPDFGGAQLHPTAGASIVGARKFLIAFNINLATDDVQIAKEIARTIRASSGGMAHVKALGLMLHRRGQAQVSMNLTDFEATPLHVVYDKVCSEAERRGVSVAGSELIGFIPRAAIESAAGHYLRCENFHSGAVLENRIAGLLPPDREDPLETIADEQQPAPASRALALAAGIAASLAVRCCRTSGKDPGAYEDHRAFFAAAGRSASEPVAVIVNRAGQMYAEMQAEALPSPEIDSEEWTAALTLVSAAIKKAPWTRSPKEPS